MADSILLQRKFSVPKRKCSFSLGFPLHLSKHESFQILAPVVEREESAVHWIIHYPVNRPIKIN